MKRMFHTNFSVEVSLNLTKHLDRTEFEVAELYANRVRRIIENHMGAHLLDVRVEAKGGEWG